MKTNIINRTNDPDELKKTIDSDRIDNLNKDFDEFKKTIDNKMRKLSDEIIDKIRIDPSFKKKKVKTNIFIPNGSKI
jgi:hypothetical protein